jgi:transcriptional regulator with XRE-family HTH domain
MAAKNVGTLIREARMAKGLSQEKLASEIEGLTASDISKAERGDKELSQTQLRAVAKVIGVTQKSLLEAPKGGTSSTTAASTSAKKTTASSSAKKTETKKTTSAAVSRPSSAEKLTTTEKKVLELYRAAETENKKLAVRILKGEKLELSDILPMLMNNGTIGEDGLLGGLLGKMQSLIK